MQIENNKEEVPFSHYESLFSALKPEEAVERTGKILSDPAPEVLLTNYGESSIEYTVRVWCLCEHYGDVLFPLTEHLRTAFEEHGVEMTCNHLNIHILDT